MMKQRIPVLIFTICAVLQSVWGTPAIGVRAGLDWTNISENPRSQGVDYRVRPGVVVGIDAEIPLGVASPFNLRIEALYTAKGSKPSVNTPGPSGHGNSSVQAEGIVKVDEAVLAPFLVMHIAAGRVVPFVEFGPEVGFNLTHRAEPNRSVLPQFGTPYDAPSAGTYTIPNWKSTNVGLNFGAGIAIRMGRGEAVLDGRYNLGLTNMYNGSVPSTFKTRGFSLLMGYNFFPFDKS